MTKVEKRLNNWIKSADNKGVRASENTVIENKKIEGRTVTEFRYDGEAYDIIYGYQSDGYDVYGLGEKFQNIMSQYGGEFENPSIVTFYDPNMRQ